MFEKIQRIDDMIVSKITRLHNPYLNKIMVVATFLGCGALIWWITLCLPFVMMAEFRVTGLILITALGVTYVSGEILIKRLIGRVRPSSLLGDDELIVKRPKDYSFPSGHTSSSFTAVVVTFMRCSPAVWVPVLFGAILISFSRMYLRVHYFSDVMSGVLLGVISGFVCTVASQVWIAPGL